MKTPIWKRLLCMFLSAAMLVTLAACGTESSVGASAPDSATVAKVDEASDEATTTTDAVSVAELPAGATEDLKSKWSSLSGKTLRVATSGQQAGWSQDDGNGSVEGMDIDVMDYICDYYGINLEWVVGCPTRHLGYAPSGWRWIPLPALPPSTRTA